VRRLFAPLLALALLAGLAGCAGRAAAPMDPIQVFAPADRKAGPELTGELLDGSGTYDSATVAGKVLVVNFWGSWCGPCVGEASELEATYQAQQASGVEFLGVDVLDQRDNARAFAQQNNTYPSIFDPASKLALGFAVQPNAVPVTIILDRQGRIAAVARAAVVRTELEPVVASLAAEAA
jgi:thiol-disulfide isomerase/thioredoxin